MDVLVRVADDWWCGGEQLLYVWLVCSLLTVRK
jgi:hypothetical protein